MTASVIRRRRLADFVLEEQGGVPCWKTAVWWRYSILAFILIVLVMAAFMIGFYGGLLVDGKYAIAGFGGALLLFSGAIALIFRYHLRDFSKPPLTIRIKAKLKRAEQPLKRFGIRAFTISGVLLIFGGWYGGIFIFGNFGIAICTMVLGLFMLLVGGVLWITSPAMK